MQLARKTKLEYYCFVSTFLKHKVKVCILLSSPGLSTAEQNITETCISVSFNLWMKNLQVDYLMKNYPFKRMLLSVSLWCYLLCKLKEIKPIK